VDGFFPVTSDIWHLPALNVRVASSLTLCVPRTELIGPSLTALTLMVPVLGDWSRSTPPLAVPPLSCTWKDRGNNQVTERHNDSPKSIAITLRLINQQKMQR
jgi:hypothetical protein